MKYEKIRRLLSASHWDVTCRQAFRFSDKQPYRGAMRTPMPSIGIGSGIFYFVSCFLISNFVIILKKLNIFYAKNLFSFAFFVIFCNMLPEFCQLLLLRPNQSMTAKGLRNLDVKIIDLN